MGALLCILVLVTFGDETISKLSSAFLLEMYIGLPNCNGKFVLKKRF